MKKLLTILLLISTAYAQTQIKYIDPTTKDTVFTNYTFTQPLPIIIATTTVHGYKPPIVVPPVITPPVVTPPVVTPPVVTPPVVTPPVVTPPVVTPPSTGMTTVGGKVSAPVICQSGQTYSGLTIDLGNTSGVAFTCNNVSNVTIVNCKVINGAKGIGVFLNGSTNVIISKCFLTLVGQGILAKSTTLQILDSQFKNIVGTQSPQAPTSPAGTTWHVIQLQNCNGAGIRIQRNRIYSDTLIAKYTHDLISIVNSNGIKGDSIMITDNMLWGNQFVQNGIGWRGMTKSNNGADGPGLGDGGGSFQVCRNNIMMYTGIIIDGRGSNMSIDHNIIYQPGGPIGGDGAGLIFFAGNGTGNFVGHNRVYFKQFHGNMLNWNLVNGTNTAPAGWSTNVQDNSLTPAILPNPLITFQ